MLLVERENFAEEQEKDPAVKTLRSIVKNAETVDVPIALRKRATNFRIINDGEFLPRGKSISLGCTSAFGSGDTCKQPLGTPRSTSGHEQDVS